MHYRYIARGFTRAKTHKLLGRKGLLIDPASHLEFPGLAPTFVPQKQKAVEVACIQGKKTRSLRRSKHFLCIKYKYKMYATDRTATLVLRLDVFELLVRVLVSTTR